MEARVSLSCSHEAANPLAYLPVLEARVGNWGEAGEVISPAVKGGAIQSLFPALPHLAEGDSAVQAVGGAPTPASLCEVFA